MKKSLILFVLTALTANLVFAQKDVDAKKILNQVSLKYRSYDVVKADFTFTVENPQTDTKDSQTGTLVSKSKANKYKMTIYSPGDKAAVDQEIISDGKSQWTYLKKDKEVQLSDVDKTGESLNPAQIFTIYEHGYKYLFTGTEKIGGRLYQTIDLTPEDSKKTFFKVRLTIDKLKKQIYSAMIFDKNGSRYNYVIKSFAPNINVPESTFTFDKKDHPGVEVVDLR
ncbi:MAG TPA: outer membrane lipoprotein carrier protein LolA [Mucilaginibacter sp.]|nr:outer membrane lipoprotein carrier protein LolA [Mucilaginibacter sp.]